MTDNMKKSDTHICRVTQDTRTKYQRLRLSHHK